MKTTTKIEVQPTPTINGFDSVWFEIGYSPILWHFCVVNCESQCVEMDIRGFPSLLTNPKHWFNLRGRHTLENKTNTANRQPHWFWQTKKSTVWRPRQFNTAACHAACHSAPFSWINLCGRVIHNHPNVKWAQMKPFRLGIYSYNRGLTSGYLLIIRIRFLKYFT